MILLPILPVSHIIRGWDASDLNFSRESYERDPVAQRLLTEYSNDVEGFIQALRAALKETGVSLPPKKSAAKGTSRRAPRGSRAKGRAAGPSTPAKAAGGEGDEQAEDEEEGELETESEGDTLLRWEGGAAPPLRPRPVPSSAATSRRPSPSPPPFAPGLTTPPATGAKVKPMRPLEAQAAAAPPPKKPRLPKSNLGNTHVGSDALSALPLIPAPPLAPWTWHEGGAPLLGPASSQPAPSEREESLMMPVEPLGGGVGAGGGGGGQELSTYEVPRLPMFAESQPPSLAGEPYLFPFGRTGSRFGSPFEVWQPYSMGLEHLGAGVIDAGHDLE